MQNNKLVSRAFLDALGTAVYVGVIAFIPTFAEKFFGDHEPGFLGPFLFLLLFVFSAAVTGSLVLLKPILLYLSGTKEDAVRLFVYTLGFLFLFVLLATILVITFG